jgi:hypothetical protein
MQIRPRDRDERPLTPRPPLPHAGEGESGAPSRLALAADGPGAAANVRARLRGVVRSLRAFFYGMTAYEFERHALGERARLEDLFVLITLGDIIGVPILPPYYSLRLLPFAVPRLETWKRRLLRERHTLENEEYDLIEL